MNILTAHIYDTADAAAHVASFPYLPEHKQDIRAAVARIVRAGSTAIVSLFTHDGIEVEANQHATIPAHWNL